MKLQQGQQWVTPAWVVRVVKLERLAVEYKAIPREGGGEGAAEGTHHRVSKKEFCRLIRSASLAGE